MAKLTDTELIGKYIGRKIRLFMDKNGVTVLDVANRLGIKSPNISVILSGRTYTTNLDRYEKIAIAAWMAKRDFDSIVAEARRNELDSSTSWIQTCESKPEDVELAFRAKHGISDAEYGKYRSELLAERARLNDAVDGFSGLDMSLAEKTDVLVKLLKNLSDTYENGSDALKGGILKAGLVKLSVDSEKRLEIQQKEVFEHLFAIGYLLGTPLRTTVKPRVLQFLLSLRDFDLAPLLAIPLAA